MPNETDIGSAALSADDPNRIRVEFDEEESRVEDPEKAHVMALAGDEDRSEAAVSRDLAQNQPPGEEDDEETERHFDNADASDNRAGVAEAEAGQRYDANKGLLEDVEKAHVMALASDEGRTEAANGRVTANLGQVHTEALVEDANREARGGMAFESEWAGPTVNSLREDLEAQLEFTEAHPETVDALMTAAKADAFDTISNELGRFTKDFSRRPDRGEVKLRQARDATEKARDQAYSNHVEAWKILQNAEDVYNRSLTFALQELTTGHAQRPYKTKSTGLDRNDFEIIGREYDGPHVRAVIEGFIEKSN